MKKPTLREVFTIPNLLSYFRILLIPLFVYWYLCAETPAQFFRAALVLGISGLTDTFDGRIARRFNQITELGILLDPVADKLTEGAVVLCLSTRYSWMWLLVALYVAKEGFMAIAGLVMLRRGKKLNGAKWYGKVCTFVFYIVTVLLILWVNIPQPAANGLILFCGGVMAFTLAMYIPVFLQMSREAKAGRPEGEETGRCGKF